MGTRRHVREEGDEQGIDPCVFFCFDPTAIHIQNVTQRLERKVGDAQRQNKIEPGIRFPIGRTQHEARDLKD
jgi:hypothetical protein